MTVSMRVMGAGDGVEYLLHTVVADDGDRSLTTPLTRYYAEKGTPPGQWLGSGLPGLAVDGASGIETGDTVSEEQLVRLLAHGVNPIDGTPLGAPYPKAKTLADRISERVAALDRKNPNLGPHARALAVEQIEAEETERGTRKVVAGFDFTFSIPKSASVLWAVADAGVQQLIATAHAGAVADVVAFLESDVASTRLGRNGVEHREVRGVVATGFDHYDSRANDPHLHTHVVVANKVQTVDGRWRTLDSRALHKATVALSELHEAIVADHLTRTLGVDWEARDMGKDRNPAWAITAVPETLVHEFSSRSRHITEETARLITTYETEHRRAPSARTVIRLRAQATLATRPPKHVHALADLTASWRARAGRLLGKDATAWARSATTNEPALLLRADDIPLDVLTQYGRTVVETVGEKRATWSRWNLLAEAARQTMGWRFATTTDREVVLALIVDAARGQSITLTPPEAAISPDGFTRTDGTTVFRPKHHTLYSSTVLLEAEDRLLARSRTTTGPTLTLATVERVTGRPDRDGRTLGPDQAEALARIAVSGRVVDLLVGPAGAGKTTAMSALRKAWEAEHGPGSVVGLAPSAVAAQVLADDLGIQCENTAKWWEIHQRTGATFTTGQLVIVDEASLAGTLSLDRITALAEQAGAKVLLVGDYAQLQSIDAGGAFAMLTAVRDDTPELTDIHRFTSPWEKTASLGLRHGDTTVIDIYDSHDRIHAGPTDTMIQAAYAGWRCDTLASKTSILVTDSGESVTALNTKARNDLIIDGTITGDREVPLRDGTFAAAGDTVITRKNDRRLRAGRGFVRNGERWTVHAVRDDGSLTLRRAATTRDAEPSATVTLPAAYVAENLDLGYAVTSYRAQGVTTDTAHVLVDASMTGENLYVALTRGRHSNQAYVATDRPDDAHQGQRSDEPPNVIARRVLFGVLHHEGSEKSAHQTITAEHETWGNIGQLADEYEALAAAAQHERWATLIRSSGLTPGQAEDTITSEAFGALTTGLRQAEADGHDLDRLLPRLATARGFRDADDIAAVLHYRVQRAIERFPGSGRTRQTPQLIVGLIPEATGTMTTDMQTALNQRRQLIETRADTVLDRALATGHAWTKALGPIPTNHQAAAEWRRNARIVAAYRDRHHITSPDPLGPPPATDTQRIDAARTKVALSRAATSASIDVEPSARRPGGSREPFGRHL